MDMVLRWIPAALKVDRGLLGVMWFPKAGDRNLLAGRGCVTYTSHNVFKYEQNRNRRYWLLVSGPGKTMIWVCSGLNCYFEYPMRDKELDIVFKVEETAILAFPCSWETGTGIMLRPDAKESKHCGITQM